MFTKVWAKRLTEFGNGGYGEPRFAIPMYIWAQHFTKPGDGGSGGSPDLYIFRISV